MIDEANPYDVELPRSFDKTLARFLRSLVEVGGWFTDATVIESGGLSYPPVLFRIFLPLGSEPAFLEKTSLRPVKPPRVSSNYVIEE